MSRFVRDDCFDSLVTFYVLQYFVKVLCLHVWTFESWVRYLYNCEDEKVIEEVFSYCKEFHSMMIAFKFELFGQN